MKHTRSRLWSGRRRLAPENYDIYWDSVSWDQSLEPPTSTEVIIRGHFHPGTLQSPTERDLTSSLPVLTRQKVFSNLGTQRGFKLGLWHQKRPLKVFYWVFENLWNILVMTMTTNMSRNKNSEISISIVVVGDSQCGKTQLINKFQNFNFSKVRLFQSLVTFI